ncbi:mandelate racemase/muconate lactonizing enzyme family protein [Botrimarina colliarenosi]|uniref:mandelate racemase/muconate lactonizing enzyme family protein n=1 Tax=Botrimarina colliarenosi TaxID=2528001 RepID=UPI001E60C2BA|nr:mandelate racemase/muconate lactonizing enzyme family protein [Botrimarina colliarenosi]
MQWVWPSMSAFEVRHTRLRRFCERLARRWSDFDMAGHPLEIGEAFQQEVLEAESEQEYREHPSEDQLPLLATLVCCSPFDIALYDAYGRLHGKSVFEMLNRDYMNRDLSAYLEADADVDVDFHGQFPSDYLVHDRPQSLVAWHLVGGLDPISEAELTGDEPVDGHPVLLGDWIARDGLQCLKVKLRGTDAAWDYDRLVSVGRVAQATGVQQLTADFNCTVMDPAYVVAILDRLAAEEPAIYDSILYIEQPFPYDLEEYRIDVREVSRRKLLLLDESAHNWQLVRLGRSLGWSGVALKTCKTLTGALLSLCWAKAHGMAVMVQDLTNPMIAQAPHVLLAAHCGTLMGVETNAMQFYPSASDLEAKVHPGLYRRRDGCIDLSSLRGSGFGYRIEEVHRPLPVAAARYGVAE